MMTITTLYFLLNLLLALGMHVLTLRSTHERPKTAELIVYLVVFLLFGSPLLAGVILFGAFSMLRGEKRPSGIAAHTSGLHAAHQ